MANASQNVALQNVQVTLNIQDGSQQSASSVFGIKGPILTGVTAVDGTGVINSGATANVTWTLTPTRDAAPTADAQYYVGGTLSYTQDGKKITVPLFPAPITVMPDPLLQFHYFWQRDVYSDDPFTTLVEPSEPFSLGLLVTNKGYGTARNLSIASGQPKIVDNEKGLLIDFKLIGSQVNTAAVSPSFTAALGDVAPQSTAAARWLLTSSLQGRFSDYTATFRHVDDLGSPKTSLLDSVDIHELEHVVRADVPADDGKPDFLVNDIPDPATPADPALPDTLWLSDGTTAPVTALTNGVVDSAVSDAHLTVRLKAPPTAGWVYLRLADPSQGRYTIRRIVRSDGRELLPDQNGWGNVWTTHRTIRLQNQAPYTQDRLYLLDKDSTGAYTLYFAPPAPINQPLGGLKTLADGTTVAFGANGTGGGTGPDGNGPLASGGSGPVVVTAAFPDALYLEALDRSSGIKAVPAGGGRVGDLVTGTGTIQTDANGERYLALKTLTVVGAGRVDPLELTSKAFYGGDSIGYDGETGAGQKGMAGGAGLNPVGLLTATLGRVVSSGGGIVQVDDGYGRPLQLVLPAEAAAPSVGSLVGAAGVVSVEKRADGLYPVLRLRAAADLFADVSGLAGRFQSPAGTLVAGENLFSLPGVPANPSPAVVLQFLPPGDGSGLIGRLNRYDAPTQSEIFWDVQGVQGPFGNFLLGEGYRLPLNPEEPNLIGFDGLRADFADLWVSLPRLGATRIGPPLPVSVDWSQVLVTDGAKTITLLDAAQTEFPHWLSSKARYWDGATQTFRTLGLPGDNPDSTLLAPWQGYWITSMKGNLALIVPAHAGIPALVSLVPMAATAGGPDFVLTVNGDRFTSGSLVRWNGAVRPTAWASSQRLLAAIPAADIAAPGTATVTVITPGPYGGTSNPLAFSIQARSGVPTLTGLSPLSVSAGSSAFTLTVTGKGFYSGSVVQWNGAARPTTYVSSTQVTVAIAAADVATAGAAAVTVVNGPPGGGTSNSLTFTVGVPRLAFAVTSSSRSGGVLSLVYRVSNTGTAPASNVRLTSVTLGPAPTTTTLPVVWTTLAAGQSETVTLTFPGSAGAVGATVTLSVQGSMGGGAFADSRRLKLP